jgi:hypothetical protein
MRAPDAAQRAALGAWCAADPGSMLHAVRLWVPALRCIVKDAAPRLGHGTHPPHRQEVGPAYCFLRRAEAAVAGSTFATLAAASPSSRQRKISTASTG